MNTVSILVFIPTFNEKANVERLFQEINALNQNFDILFIDDNSPDGTGLLLDQLAFIHSNLIVHHRKGKEGIGSAHLRGIEYAYKQDYDFLITMDCDFTHQPSDLLRLLASATDYDVIIGSRYMQNSSLPGWSFFRRCLTYFGHFLTKNLLGIQVDASSGLRVYNLKKIPSTIFQHINSSSYSFFFESLFYLKNAGCTFREVGIVLPGRQEGESKMNFREAIRSGMFLLKLSVRRLIIWFKR